MTNLEELAGSRCRLWRSLARLAQDRQSGPENWPEFQGEVGAGQHQLVTPAKAGVHVELWIPAFAGMTLAAGEGSETKGIKEIMANVVWASKGGPLAIPAVLSNSSPAGIAVKKAIRRSIQLSLGARGPVAGVPGW